MGRIISIVLSVVLLAGCNGRPAVEEAALSTALVSAVETVASPSGEYFLAMEEAAGDGVPGFRVAILAAEDSTPVFVSEEVYRYRDTHYLLWGRGDVVWLYHGDVGTFYWQKGEDGWERLALTAGESDAEVPDLLRELRPDIFT